MSENKEKIILDVAYQPQVRTNTDTRRLMLNVLIGLLPAVLVALWQNGIASLLMIAVSVASAVIFEWGYRKLMKKPDSLGDLSACVTGLLLALVMPTGAKWWMLIIGNLFAIIVVKQLYGGIGKNFLNPALAGRAFLLSSYTAIMGSYTLPAALKGIDGVSSATALSYLKSGAALPEWITMKDLFIGTCAGSIGEISALAILIGGIWLIATKTISWRIPVYYIGSVALICLVSPKGDYSGVQYAVLNVISGGVMLGAFFMATDYATSPVTKGGQIVYGIGCGLITVLIRRFGGYPEGVTYAILIMNICAWALDKAFHRHQFGVSKEDLAAAKAAKKAAKEAAK